VEGCAKLAEAASREKSGTARQIATDPQSPCARVFLIGGMRLVLSVVR